MLIVIAFRKHFLIVKSITLKTYQSNRANIFRDNGVLWFRNKRKHQIVINNYEMFSPSLYYS